MVVYLLVIGELQNLLLGVMVKKEILSSSSCSHYFLLYSSADQNGLNIISQSGSSTEDYIKLYAGGDADGTIPNLFIGGTGATKGFVGVNTETPSERLHINGDVRVDGNPALLELYYTSDTKTQIGQNSFGFLQFNRNPTTNEEEAFIVNYAASGNTIFRCGPNGSDVDDVMYLYGSGNTAANPLLIFSGDSKPLVYSDGNLEVFGNIGIKQLGSVVSSNAVFIDYLGVRDRYITPLIVESIKEIHNNPSIPNYTPSSSNDSYGNIGNITSDDDYLYIKTNNGWKRTSLQSF